MLSKTSIHALKALVELSRLPEDEYLGAAQLAKRINAPQNYLGKLLQALSLAGILQSQKGLGGGFRLAREASKIKLFDVVEPIDHVSRWNGCLMGQSACREDTPCALHGQWAQIRNAFLKMLLDSTLSDIASHSSG